MVGRPEVAALLIEQGANVNKVTHQGLNPLSAAAVKGNVDIMQVLRNGGASLIYNNALTGLVGFVRDRACAIFVVSCVRALCYVLF